MKVEELITRDPATLRPDATCSEAAALMKREDRGSVGVVPDHDRGIGHRRSDMTAEDASKLMSEKQVRRLPVVESGRLAGMLVIGSSPGTSQPVRPARRRWTSASPRRGPGATSRGRA